MGRSTPLLLKAPPPWTKTVHYRDVGMYEITNPGSSQTAVFRSESFDWTTQDIRIYLPGTGTNTTAFPSGTGSGTGQSTPLRRNHGCQVVGGHNVVIIGGQVDVDQDWATGSRYTSGDPTPYLSQRCRSMYFLNFTGSLHVEGVLFTGAWQYEILNFQIGAGGSGEIHWFNNWVQAKNGAGADPVSRLLGNRYYPLTIGGTGNHDGGDCFQPFDVGDSRKANYWVYIDGYQMERAAFQGLFIRRGDTDTAHFAGVTITNIGMPHYGGPGGAMYVNKGIAGTPAYPGEIRIGPNCQFEPAPVFTPAADGVLDVQPFNTAVDTQCYPVQSGSGSGVDAVNYVRRITGDGPDPYGYSPIWRDLAGTLTTTAADGTPALRVSKWYERTNTATDVLSYPSGQGYASPGYLDSVIPTSSRRHFHGGLARP